MGLLCRQSRVVSLLKKLRPALSNPLAPFPPVLQPIQKLARFRPNHAQKNSNHSLLFPFALKKKYIEHIQAETVFLPDIDDINIYSLVL